MYANITQLEEEERQQKKLSEIVKMLASDKTKQKKLEHDLKKIDAPLEFLQKIATKKKNQAALNEIYLEVKRTREEAEKLMALQKPIQKWNDKYLELEEKRHKEYEELLKESLTSKKRLEKIEQDAGLVAAGVAMDIFEPTNYIFATIPFSDALRDIATANSAEKAMKRLDPNFNISGFSHAIGNLIPLFGSQTVEATLNFTHGVTGIRPRKFILWRGINYIGHGLKKLGDVFDILKLYDIFTGEITKRGKK